MLRQRVEIKKEDLEWICEQLECLESDAESIRSESYNCRTVVEKLIKEAKVGV